MRGKIFFMVTAGLSLLGLGMVMSGYHLFGTIMLLLLSTVALVILTLTRKTKTIGWTAFAIICTFAAAILGFQEVYESKGVMGPAGELSHKICQEDKSLAEEKKCRTTLHVHARHLSFVTTTTARFGNVSPTNESIDWANAQRVYGKIFFTLLTVSIPVILLRRTIRPRE